MSTPSFSVIPTVASAAKKAKEILQAEPLYVPADSVVNIPDWMVIAAALLLVFLVIRWKFF